MQNLIFFNHIMNPIYIHIPYCLHKCGYCDFNSHPENREESEIYVSALLSEIEHYAPQLADQEVPTVFFGGGTPTLLPPASLDKILAKVKHLFSLTQDCEITIEANPATIKRETLEQIRSSGFNRISIGVQSFDLDELKLLERVHNEEEIHTTVDRARLAGFDNLSLDLMSGLPGQSPEKWQSHLLQAIDKNPDHISAYGLTIEPATSFHKLQERGLLTLPPEDTQLEMFQETIKTLQSAGYEQYEISNFAKSGYECGHNQGYWRMIPYLGFGPSAHSYDGFKRWWNTASLDQYLQLASQNESPISGSEILSDNNKFNELIFNGLRMTEGAAIKELERHYQGLFRSYLEQAMIKWPQLLYKDGYLKLSEKGVLLADEISADLFVLP